MFSSQPNHNHSLYADEMPDHCHCRSHSTVYNAHEYTIDIRSGHMYQMNSYLDEPKFLDRMCECIISKYSGHDIELFKAGRSMLLKEKIMEFLREV